ncbi:DUF981 family protein [Candidatus Parvarchaeota archaeon]|jgi:putative membrane protein|nr:DUF981 family protein [Candidatus Parvarchaeota archaeon]
MAFVDSLAVMLLITGFSAIILALFVYFSVRGKKDMSMLVVPGFIFGLFDLVSGFIMSFTWPLPGAYNMLFGDPILALGLLLVAGSYMIYKKMDVRVLSIFAFFLGIYIAMSAAGMANFNLESGSHFLAAFGFYVAASLSALFSPVVYLNAKGSGKYAYYLLFVLLVITAFAALFLGYTSIYQHLQAPP